MYAPSALLGEPEALNFFFAVDISVQPEPGQPPIRLYIGQGSPAYFFENNWWIGGAAVDAQGPSFNAPYPCRISGSNDSFTFTSPPAS
jgi:hypothetical protein